MVAAGVFEAFHAADGAELPVELIVRGTTGVARQR
jgi:hypothetical protein